MKPNITPAAIIALILICSQSAFSADAPGQTDSKPVKSLNTQHNSDQPKSTRRTSTEALIKRCNQCHGPEGEATMPDWPPIRELSEQAIIAKLKGHRAKLVPDSMMQKVAHDLSDCEIEQIAKYYVRLNQKKLNKAPEAKQ